MNRDKRIKFFFFFFLRRNPPAKRARFSRATLFFFFVGYSLPPPLPPRGSLHALPLNNPISRDRVQRCDARALMTLVIDTSRVGCDASIRETHRRVLFSAFPPRSRQLRLPSAGLNKTSPVSSVGNRAQPKYFLSTAFFFYIPPRPGIRFYHRSCNDIYSYFRVYHTQTEKFVIVNLIR